MIRACATRTSLRRAAPPCASSRCTAPTSASSSTKSQTRQKRSVCKLEPLLRRPAGADGLVCGTSGDVLASLVWRALPACCCRRARRHPFTGAAPPALPFESHQLPITNTKYVSILTSVCLQICRRRRPPRQRARRGRPPAPLPLPFPTLHPPPRLLYQTKLALQARPPGPHSLCSRCTPCLAHSRNAPAMCCTCGVILLPSPCSPT